MRKFFTFQLLVQTYHYDNKSNNSDSLDSTDKNEPVVAPERCVENILNFARSYRVAESKSAGKIEMILN